jgi:hypothetical protein
MPSVGDVFLHIGLNVDNSIMYLMKKPFSNRIDSFHGVMYVKQLMIESPDFFLSPGVNHINNNEKPTLHEIGI